MGGADKVERRVFKVVFSIYKVVCDVCSLADVKNHFVRLPDGTVDKENGVAGLVCGIVCAANDLVCGAN